MSLDFDKYAEKGNEILNMLADDLEVTKDRAGQILRAVLYAMRSHINLDESLQVIARLPMALKSVYVDQWDPWHSFHRIHHVDEFIAEVRKNDKPSPAYSFENDKSVKQAVGGVFNTLSHYLSEGEFRDVIAVMPRELKEFIHKGIAEKSMEEKNETSRSIIRC